MSPFTPLVGQSARTRFAFYSMRLLAWSSGLEAFVSTIGMAYAIGFIVFGQHPALVSAYPLAEQVAYVLGVTGLIATIALNKKLRWLRQATSLVAFLCWGLLALAAAFEQADLMPRHAFLLGVFALGELAVFLRLHLGMEQMADTLDAAAFANNLAVASTGQPLPPLKTAEQTDDGASNLRT